MSIQHIFQQQSIHGGRGQYSNNYKTKTVAAATSLGEGSMATKMANKSTRIKRGNVANYSQEGMAECYIPGSKLNQQSTHGGDTTTNALAKQSGLGRSWYSSVELPTRGHTKPIQ